MTYYFLETKQGLWVFNLCISVFYENHLRGEYILGFIQVAERALNLPKSSSSLPKRLPNVEIKGTLKAPADLCKDLQGILLLHRLSAPA
ncbi:hypothetical protein FRX31_030259 [Thalictrum thalictroides]|uniref:Uncharacterized protein n=1 Tax=Thalictrum thalictroides TaxID=46969 RepID=A0A7J6V5H1_THATH|nr:hypothetical protein FRX31_030259 [Thalictrum thalictroides]